MTDILDTDAEQEEMVRITAEEARAGTVSKEDALVTEIRQEKECALHRAYREINYAMEQGHRGATTSIYGKDVTFSEVLEHVRSSLAEDGYDVRQYGQHLGISWEE